jgi:hypothetical protein
MVRFITEWFYWKAGQRKMIITVKNADERAGGYRLFAWEQVRGDGREI